MMSRQELLESRELPRLNMMAHLAGAVHERPVSPTALLFVCECFAEAGVDQELEFHLN